MGGVCLAKDDEIYCYAVLEESSFFSELVTPHTYKNVQQPKILAPLTLTHKAGP